MKLIIAGHPRSGTTLFQRLCDQHPEIRVTNEFGNYYFANQPFLSYASNMIRRWWYVRDKWAYDASYLDKQADGRHNLIFTIRYLFKLAALGLGPVKINRIGATLARMFPDARIVGDKLPHYWVKLDSLVQSKEIAVVFLYRDCRDVTSSFLEQARTIWKTRPWIGKINTAEKIAARWVDVVNVMEAHDNDIHAVRYESLVCEPEICLESLSHILGVDFNGFNLELASSKSIGKYETGLTNKELDKVLEIAGPTMARLGYR